MTSEDDPPPSRRIYGRGIVDTLAIVGVSYEEYQEKKMNQGRMKSIIKGLTGIAKKTYECVPIGEEWSPATIATEMIRTGNRVEMRVLEGCLRSLVESGVVEEPARGMFKRPQIKEKVVQPNPAVSLVPPPAPAPAPLSALDALAGLSAKLKALAAELDNIALSVEEQLNAAAGKNEKLVQLQKLLKDLT